ncbi:putative histone tail methylase containing set domain, partial [Globisporangium splendens]
MALYDQVECMRKGRCAVARQRIAAGTRILLVSAFASISVSACNWCFSTPQTQKLQKCGGCHRVKYCSRKCQQLDWTRSLHAKECAAWKYVPKHIKGESMQTVLLVTRMAAKLFLTDQEHSADGQAMLQLRHHYDDHGEDKLRQYREMTQLVLVLLARSKFNARGASFEELAELLEDKIVRLFCRVNCNAFTVSDDLCVPLGIGVFPHGALFNHSCDPNCVVSFEQQQMVVHTIKDVQQGDELTISYIELLESTPKRQHALRESYFFECDCSRCRNAVSESSTHDDWFLYGYACRNTTVCGQQGVVVLDATKEDQTLVARCKSCGSERSKSEIQRYEDECERIEQELKAQKQLPSSPETVWRLYQQLWFAFHGKLHLHQRNIRIASLARDMGTFLLENPPSSFLDGEEAIPTAPMYYFMQELHATEWILPTLKLPSRGLLHFQLAKLYYEGRDEYSSRSCSKTVGTEKEREHFHHALSMYVLTIEVLSGMNTVILTFELFCYFSSLNTAYGSDNALVQVARSYLDEVARASQM